MGQVGSGTDADFQYDAPRQGDDVFAKLPDGLRIPETAYQTGVNLLYVQAHSCTA
jgi:hypothetical protein